MKIDKGGWKKRKLGEICEVKGGKRLPKGHEYVNEVTNHPYIRVIDFKNNSVNFKNLKYISNKTAEIIKRYTINKNDVYISIAGTIGVVGTIPDSLDNAQLTENAAKIMFDNKILYNKYLVSYLNSIIGQNQIKSKTLNTTQPKLALFRIEEIEIPLPTDIEEQKYIAKILDTVSDIINLHKKSIEELDKLIQSTFYDMFGDPISNDMGWEVINIKLALLGKISNGFFAKRNDYVDNGNVEILGVSNIVNYMYSNLNQLPQTNATENDINKYRVKYGDLLFCRSSLVKTGIGKASMIPKNIQNNVLFECHVIRVSLNLDMCVPEFIQLLTTTNYFRNQIMAYSKTSTMTTISQEGILNSNIILPPKPLQEKFANIVNHIEEQKTQVNKALEDSQMLFDSLMQKYFE